MRILIITSEFNFFAGYERLSLELASGLINNGHDVDLVSLYSQKYNAGITGFNKLSKVGARSIYFLGIDINSKLFNYIRAILQLRKILYTGNYDVIEVSGFSSSFITALSLIGFNVKTFIGIHRIYESKEHSDLKFIIWKKIMRLSNCIEYYAISEAVRVSWLKFHNTNRKNVHLLYNSINDLYFDDKNITFANKNFNKRILFVGRLIRSKGVETLYYALKDMLKSYNLELLIVGNRDNSESPDDMHMIDRIMADIRNSHLTSHIKFLGHKKDVRSFMISSDILIHPALSEGFGLVIAEALACGMQIISTNVGGIPEVLFDTDGLIIPPNDIDALKNALLVLLNRSQDELDISVTKNKKKSLQYKNSIRVSNFLKIVHA